MGLVAIYIKGRSDFQGAVISKLERTWLLGSPEAKGELVMFWLPEAVTLRDLKIAIGSKLIFKYRLHFITNLNGHLKIEDDKADEFSVSENKMIQNMVLLENTQYSRKKEEDCIN